MYKDITKALTKTQLGVRVLEVGKDHFPLFYLPIADLLQDPDLRRANPKFVNAWLQIGQSLIDDREERKKLRARFSGFDYADQLLSLKLYTKGLSEGEKHLLSLIVAEALEPLIQGAQFEIDRIMAIEAPNQPESDSAENH